MVDVSALAALIVAAVALLIAGLQLTQALLATAYVIKKCDRLVTGGVTRGGIREWHWRQFRFTVKYEAILFALPASVYTSLRVSPTVQIDKAAPEVHQRALERRSKRTHDQGCWVSLVQDLVHFSFLQPEDIGIREESGDRIPDELTIAPTRVDALTVMLTCVAMGMQVINYSPGGGQITLAGGSGSVSSSVHPTLGLMLHYSVFRSDPWMETELTRQHGDALRQIRGVWPNVIFGRFLDDSYQPDYVKLMTLQERKVGVLKEQGWPENSVSDTILGAACFMAFGHVRVYKTVPPSHSRAWCANFAEVIVKGHHYEIMRAELKTQNAPTLSQEACQLRKDILERSGGSSPFLWEYWRYRTTGFADMPQEEYSRLFSTFLECEESSKLIACPEVVAIVATSFPALNNSLFIGREDPSMYLAESTMPICWEIIQRADQCMAHIIHQLMSVGLRIFTSQADKIVARTIVPLAELGAPSWGRITRALQDWPLPFDIACTEILKSGELPEEFDSKILIKYAYLSLMRSAYYTIMMRASGDVGPGIGDDSAPDTALAYMA